METRKIMLMAAAAFMLLGNVIPASAQATGTEIIFGNGLGAEITELILTPSKDQYAKNRNCYAQTFQVNDKTVFSMVLPEHFLRYESFDIEVTAGGKRFATKHGVKLDREKGAPVLELSETGKDSSIGLISGLSTAAGTIVFMTGTPAGRKMMANIVYSIYRWKGFAVILSIPTAAGAIGYAVGNALAPCGLDVQVAYIN